MIPYQGGSWWISYVWHQIGTKRRVVQLHWAGHQVNASGLVRPTIVGRVSDGVKVLERWPNNWGLVTPRSLRLSTYVSLVSRLRLQPEIKFAGKAGVSRLTYM